MESGWQLEITQQSGVEVTWILSMGGTKYTGVRLRLDIENGGVKTQFVIQRL